MGTGQYLASSPKTWRKFLVKPRLKPFLSGPWRKTGARTASKPTDREKTYQTHHCLLRILYFIYFYFIRASWGQHNLIQVQICRSRPCFTTASIKFLWIKVSLLCDFHSVLTRCDLSFWTAYQCPSLSCLPLWALCLCITVKRTPLVNPYSSTQRQRVPLCAPNEKLRSW